MPTYEYACKSCGEHVEVVQSFTDDALTVCPACAGPLRKVFGNIGITFKGSGFYKTDSRKGNGAKEPAAASASSGDASSSSAKGDSGSNGSNGGGGSKGEAKPAGATPSKAESGTKPAKDSGTKAAAS